MDEARRTIIGTTGGVLMVGGIAWASTWYFASGHPSAWRLAPALAMFVLGGLLFWWGVRRPDPKRLILAQLDDAIRNGVAMEGYPDSNFEVRSRQWGMDVTSVLLRGLGETVAERFRSARDRGALSAGLNELRAIREELETGSLKIVGR